jgi:hypothetical protein
MSDASTVAKSLRERFSGTSEDRLGKALSELLENPLLTGAIGRAFDAREKAAQAQEVAMGALNIPSAADIERLTRRLRSVSHRLEGIEDGVYRLDRALAPGGVEARLSAIEQQLSELTSRLGPASAAPATGEAAPAGPAAAAAAGPAAGSAEPAGAAAGAAGPAAAAAGSQGTSPPRTAKPRKRAKAKPARTSGAKTRKQGAG